MKPKLDQFFHDQDFGRIKFAGYEDGHYLFHNYELWNKRWQEHKHTIKLKITTFNQKLKNRGITPSVPPC